MIISVFLKHRIVATSHCSCDNDISIKQLNMWEIQIPWQAVLQFRAVASKNCVKHTFSSRLKLQMAPVDERQNKKYNSQQLSAYTGKSSISLSVASYIRKINCDIHFFLSGGQLFSKITILMHKPGYGQPIIWVSSPASKEHLR